MFKAGFVQFQPYRYDVQRNIDTLKTLTRAVKADLLVLPELANSGYMYRSSDTLAPYSESADGRGPFLSALQEIACETGTVLVAGFAENAEGVLYNSAAAVGTGGVLQVYRKTHLFFDEKNLFEPGDSGFNVFEVQGVKVGMMICFDWIFPESARTLALMGAQIIAHPSNLVLPYCQTAMVTRSLENRVFSITTNRWGGETLDDSSLTFTGASQVMSPHGARLAQAPETGDSVQVIEIDPALANDKHITARNDLFADRRPECYTQ